jgi:hypothetical protein
MPEEYYYGLATKSYGKVKDLLNYNKTEVTKIMDQCYENKYDSNK